MLPAYPGNRRLYLPLRLPSGRCAASSWPSWPSPCSPPPRPPRPRPRSGTPARPRTACAFCPTSALTDRVASFDGVPLDVDVTLPPSGDGPFPTIVMLHGYGGDKTNYEASKPEGDRQPSSAPESATTYHWNSNYFARRGYAVVNPSARGFGRSCGAARLAHARLREGLDPPRRPALRGPRLPAPARPARRPGRGQARRARRHRHLLRRRPEPRARLPARPHPQPRRLVRAVAQPEAARRSRSPPPIRAGRGRTSSTRCCPTGASSTSASRARPRAATPIGVPIQSFISGLFATGAASGFYAPPGVDPGADLTTWYAPHPGRRALRRRRARDRRRDPRPPPGLRPPGHAGAAAAARRLDRRPLPRPRSRCGSTTRCGRRTRARPSRCSSPTSATQRGSNKVNADKALNDQGSAFFDAYLRGAGSPPAPGSVTAFTQTCPQGGARRRPVPGGELAGAAPGRLRVRRRGVRRPSSRAAATRRRRRPSTRSAAAATPARARASAVEPGTATYTGSRGGGYTLLGRPTVTADIATAGANGQLVSRLWDVDAAGQQVLVTRGGLPADRRPARARHLPAQRQRLPLRRRSRAAARAARPRRALLPGEQRVVQREGLERCASSCRSPSGRARCRGSGSPAPHAASARACRCACGSPSGASCAPAGA